jgi:tripartite-type tricarboxylate transporter receptor subunit TctC
VSSPRPVAELPGVPTFRSLNYAGLEVQGWAVLVAPKGTIPPEGLARLEGMLARALASESVQKRFAALGVTPLVMTRDATSQYLKAEAARYAGVIRTSGIKSD